MNPHIHEVNERKHQVFLNEGRSDPFTKEKIKAGDRIVFCAGCKSAFLYSSWEAMRGKHCKQTETLIEFPHPRRFYRTTKLRPPTPSPSPEPTVTRPSYSTTPTPTPSPSPKPTVTKPSDSTTPKPTPSVSKTPTPATPSSSSSSSPDSSTKSSSDRLANLIIILLFFFSLWGLKAFFSWILSFF